MLRRFVPLRSIGLRQASQSQRILSLQFQLRTNAIVADAKTKPISEAPESIQEETIKGIGHVHNY